VIKEAERDGRGLRRALLLGEREEGSGIDEDEGEGQDLQVEELERMMGRLKGVRGEFLRRIFSLGFQVYNPWVWLCGGRVS